MFGVPPQNGQVFTLFLLFVIVKRKPHEDPACEAENDEENQA